MLRYIVARLVQAVPVLFITSIAIFVFMRLLPGDPALAIAGMNARPEQVAAIREHYHLDRPLVEQYLAWVRQLAHGDFGTSIASQIPVGTLIWQRMPVTLTLALAAMVVTVGIGLPVGLFLALRPNHPARNIADLFNAVAISLPSFWLGLLLLLCFSVRFSALPPSGYVSVRSSPWEALQHLLLPAIAIGVGGAALTSRFVAASVSDAMQSDYVRTAAAKGLANRTIVGRHVLKNALPPILTVLAIQFGNLLGGAVIAESIFGLPGLGRLMVDAIKSRDYVVVQSTMLLVVLIFMIASVVADVLYAVADPRLRKSF